ncbi:MAG TPA: hypothetical protein VFS19_00430 [Planctomycetota bacterium]|nr:hypothetical protein [Planctomycetota bacterium]
MAEDARRVPGKVVPAAFLLLAGLIGFAWVEFYSEPIVDVHSAPAGKATVTFAVARSPILKRRTSRLVMIEGQGAARDHNAWIPGHAPPQWVGPEVVLISDSAGIRIAKSSVSRELWKLEGTLQSGKNKFSLLRQIAAETRDPDLLQFVSHNK